MEISASCRELIIKTDWPAEKDKSLLQFTASGIIFSSRAGNATRERASGVRDRLGVFYILCGDWRKNRKHSYITRSNHCTQIYTHTRHAQARERARSTPDYVRLHLCLNRALPYRILIAAPTDTPLRRRLTARMEIVNLA